MTTPILNKVKEGDIIKPSVSGPILKGSQAERDANEQERADRAVKQERLAWWQLEESARRCIAISEHLWNPRLAAAIFAQRQLAETMRDRTAPGVRATGKEYEQDRSVPTPLFTPRDRLQFLKEFATTLLISARQQGLPVTVEGTKREAEKADGSGDAAEAGSGVDETPDDVEARGLAQAGAAIEAARRDLSAHAYTDDPKGQVPVSEAPAS